MLNKTYLRQVKSRILDYKNKRRDVIKLSSDAQHAAKKAIFAMQRSDMKAADSLLKEAKKILLQLGKKHKKDPQLSNEGSYKGAVEEYVEAVIFNKYLKKQTISKFSDVKVDPEVFVSGLCDVPGELLRHAIKCATERNFAEVKRAYAAAEDIVGQTMEMNLTGYNRQKFDQAKQALNKLQRVAYEVSLQGK